MFPIKPLRDNIVVLPHVAKHTTKGGVLIPDFSIPTAQEGTVMAVGRGRRTPTGTYIPVGVMVGEVVRYDRLCGVDVKVDDVDYKILPEGNIEMVLE